MSINKPVCSFNELKESYRLALNAIKNEKDKMEQDLHFTINALSQKLKEATAKLTIKIKNKECELDKVESSTTSSTSVQKIDPKQQSLYIAKIDQLTSKVQNLETENKSFRESLNFYRTSSAVKSLAITDKDLSITVLTKEEDKETREEIKEKYEIQLKELREQVEKNSLVVVLKAEKDKLEAEVKELSMLYQTSLTKIQELQNDNEEIIKKSEEYTRSILNLSNEKDKFKSEYIKTKTELKALIEYLKETKQVYEKEIDDLNRKLSANCETLEMQKKKVSNDVNELSVEYLLLRYCNSLSISVFDILSQIINKINVFKLISSEKIETNNFITLMFNEIISFIKFNPQCDINMFLSQFSLINTNEKCASDDKLYNKLQLNEEFDMELIEKKFTNSKKNMINNANTSLEIIKNSIGSFIKEPESVGSNLFKMKPHNIVDSNLITNAICIENTTSIIKGDELSKFHKYDVNYFFQIEINKIVDITLTGNLSKEYLFSILLNCNNISRLVLDCFEMSKTLSIVTLFIESFTKMKSFSILNSNLNDDILSRICYSLKSNQSIQSITLNNNKITSEGLFQFSDCLILNSGLTQIDLSNNKIKEIDPFCSVINNNHDYVTHITLADNLLTDNDFEIIGMFLSENKHLKYLNISKNKITPKAAHNLRNAIAKNTSLEELVMNQIKFNEENITLLSSQGNYGLKSIQINDTELNEGCLMLLGNAINTLKCLERLYIKNTKAKSIGLTSLLALIETKESLKELHLEGNEITEEIIITFSTGQWTNKEYPKVFISLKTIPKKFIEILRTHGSTVIVDD